VHDHRPSQSIFDATRHDAHHTLMPARVVETKPVTRAARTALTAHATSRERLRIFEVSHRGHRLLLHRRFDGPPLFVERIETRRERTRLSHRVGEQTADTETHVIESTCRIEPRAGDESEIGGNHVRERLVAHLEQSA
jgi:hypothetical protein